MKNALSLIQKDYQEFSTNTQTYHEKQASLRDGEYMVIENNQRKQAIDSVIELCEDFTVNSKCILEAFDLYNRSRTEQKIENINDITSTIIKLVSQKDVLYKWSEELFQKGILFEENKVSEMSDSELSIADN